MPTTPGQQGMVRSLAATEAGDVVEVRHVLFGILQDLCQSLGIREGEVLRCRAATPTQLVLENAKGRQLTLQRDWARYVQVSGLGGRSDQP